MPTGTKTKIFGLGLSRTGTRSLTAALETLGFRISHYPIDQTTFQELTSGNYNLSILRSYDGLTDITASPFFAQLDQYYPDSKFILTVRDREAWIKAMERHWDDKPPFGNPFLRSPSYAGSTPQRLARGVLSLARRRLDKPKRMQMRRFLRATMYGLYAFNQDRVSYVYDTHYRNVTEYFKNRPDSLLILNIIEGEGWSKLCPFLNVPTPDKKFPHNH